MSPHAARLTLAISIAVLSIAFVLLLVFMPPVRIIDTSKGHLPLIGPVTTGP